MTAPTGVPVLKDHRHGRKLVFSPSKITVVGIYADGTADALATVEPSSWAKARKHGKMAHDLDRYERVLLVKPSGHEDIPNRVEEVTSMSAALDAIRAAQKDAYAVGGVAADAFHARKYDTDMLEADIEAGGYGILTHPRTARELLRLDTPARRRRAADEAHTLGNLLGGVPSTRTAQAVTALLSNIENGREEAELSGERTAREYREREAELRQASGNPTAIYYPPHTGR